MTMNFPFPTEAGEMVTAAKMHRNLSSRALGWTSLMVLWSFPYLVGCTPPASGVAEDPSSGSPMAAQQADVGVAKQGQKLMGHSDAQKMITGPASQLLQVRQAAIFNIQIPQALQLYQAQHGRSPSNHDEFVKQILEPNRLSLPELPDGMVYQFNPEQQELWVYPADQVPSQP